MSAASSNRSAGSDASDYPGSRQPSPGASSVGDPDSDAHDPFSPDPAGGGGGSSDDGWSDAGGSRPASGGSRPASDDEGGGRSDAGDEGGDSEFESMLQAEMEGGSQ